MVHLLETFHIQSSKQALLPGHLEGNVSCFKVPLLLLPISLPHLLKKHQTRNILLALPLMQMSSVHIIFFFSYREKHNGRTRRKNSRSEDVSLCGNERTDMCNLTRISLSYWTDGTSTGEIQSCPCNWRWMNYAVKPNIHSNQKYLICGV